MWFSAHREPKKEPVESVAIKRLTLFIWDFACDRFANEEDGLKDVV